MTAWIHSYILIKFIKMWGIFIAYSFFIVLTWTWFVAFFNGDHVVVSINDWGEKWIELAMFMVIIPILVYSMFLSLKELRKMRKNVRYLLFGETKPKKVEWL